MKQESSPSNAGEGPTVSSPVVLGNFRIDRALGSGGEGKVWLGHDLGRSHRPVAVKVMASRYADDPTYRNRFYAEVRAMAALTHPRIAAIFDYGLVSRQASTQSRGMLPEGSPFMVMEYAPGGPLQSILPIRDFRRAKRILLDVLEGLAHAHARGLVHRDIKPGNILLQSHTDDNPGVLLADFGIAFAIVDSMPPAKRRLRLWRNIPHTNKEEPDDSLSLVSAQAGTPAYMAPEQIHGDPANIGPWTDLYALGCVAFRLVTGHTPFYGFGPNVKDILDAHLHQSLPPLKPLFPIPGGLQQWFSTMLAKAPWKRFQTAADAADALENLGEEGRVTVSTMPTQQPDTLHHDPRIHQGSVSAVSQDDLPTNPQTPFKTSTTGVDDDGNGASRIFAEQSPTPTVSSRRFPNNWRFVETERNAEAWTTASSSLFGLRDVPMVDRNEERTLLWDALGEVVSRRAPILASVHGPAGVGKTRLARWLCETAVEIGWAEVFRATHSRFPTTADGLGAMLARVLRCQELTPQEMYRQTRHVLEALGSDNEQTDEDLDFLAMALAGLMSSRARAEAGDGVLPRGLLPSPQARFSVVAQLLRRKALHRPVVLWIDDAQWGPDALDLAQFVAENMPASPIFLLLTYRDEELPDRPRAAELIERISRLVPGRDIKLAPLDSEDHRAMIRRMVHLDPPLVEEMVRRTGAYPLYAIQLITDWLDRGILQDTGDGLTLVAEADTSLPDDIYDMWHLRIDGLAHRFGEPAHRTLEIAAALGSEIDDDDWVMACRNVGIAIPEGMVDRLIETGLARQTDRGWKFVHPMLRESLERHAQEAGRWEAAHLACAQALANRHGQEQSEWSGDIGRHFFQAGAWQQAVTHLIHAAERASLEADFTTALEALDLVDQSLDRLDSSRQDPRSMRVRLLRAKVLFQKGEFDSSQTLLDSILASGPEIDPILQAEAWRSMAGLLRMKGKLPEALDAAKNGSRLFRESGNEPDAATCDIIIARLHFESTGNNALGLSLAQRAEKLFRKQGDEAKLAEAQYIKSLLLLAMNRRQQAISLTREARVRYGKVGNRFGEAACENFLGEVARQAHRFQDAVHHYRRAAQILESIGSDWTHVQRINIALTLVQSKRYAPAKRILEGLRGQDFGMKAAVACYIDYALLVCRAEDGQWDGWDDEYDRAIQVRPETGRVDRDLAELAMLAARKAAEANETDRAERAISLSREHWQALGDDDKIDQCRDIIDSLREDG